MTNDVTQLSATARRAIQSQDWGTVHACATEILRQDAESAEGYFLLGIVERAANRPAMSRQAFEQSLQLDGERYDAAVELANQLSVARRNGDAAALLEKYEDRLSNSPIYLDMAGNAYIDIGLPERAWPLFKKASELQPEVHRFRSNLAGCGVYLGKIEEASVIYEDLLRQFPNHRRNHYHLARLKRASDDSHLRQMLAVIDGDDDSAEKDIYLYYAIAKELEDLQRWDEAFDYYKKAGDAVQGVAQHDVQGDIELIEKVIEVCDADWLRDMGGESAQGEGDKTPVFIVGLPRTGTTLTERIISSHSSVSSLGETMFLQMVLRDESGVRSTNQMTTEMIQALATVDMKRIAERYIKSVEYRLGEEPFFVDKLPFNFLYLGFVANAWPGAKIVCQLRHPMDACFSMYKQVFTWAYKFSYTLDDLAKYYIAYDKLLAHWRSVLGERLIEVEYEAMVADQEGETRKLLDRLGLDFEEACLDFERHEAPSTTASSVQVRDKVYSGSVGRWRNFQKQLEPLRRQLESAGIAVD